MFKFLQLAVLGFADLMFVICFYFNCPLISDSFGL